MASEVCLKARFVPSAVTQRAVPKGKRLPKRSPGPILNLISLPGGILAIHNYKKEVFNGDIGTIEKIDQVEQEVFIRFDDRLVTYDYGELDEVSLAYVPSAQHFTSRKVALGDTDKDHRLPKEVIRQARSEAKTSLAPFYSSYF